MLKERFSVCVCVCVCVCVFPFEKYLFSEIKLVVLKKKHGGWHHFDSFSFVLGARVGERNSGKTEMFDQVYRFHLRLKDFILDFIFKQLTICYTIKTVLLRVKIMQKVGHFPKNLVYVQNKIWKTKGKHTKLQPSLFSSTRSLMKNKIIIKTLD